MCIGVQLKNMHKMTDEIIERENKICQHFHVNMFNTDFRLTMLTVKIDCVSIHFSTVVFSSYNILIKFAN